ncbi:phage baseplate assembly protein V [uncultured Thiohalocapsa sp.]|uniref:phage baseplate assembly protein V n=1 Tax=uncultured Thiohalocapsa sp. TaxID=768990 RepID=UPI0025F0EFEF|nr:phage baseplate assembly protein V [uncultured Thiohalocapsa sp.]
MTPHGLGELAALHLAEVQDNQDPDARGRIQVSLVGAPTAFWAPVVVPSAGGGYGLACLPRIGELVVVGFVTPDLPLVLGALWSGADSFPDAADPPEDHYLLRTPRGCMLQLDDGAGPRATLRTPSGNRVEIDDGAGEVRIRRGGDEVTLAQDGISITAAGRVSVQAGADVEVNAAMVTVNAAMSSFSGVLQADTVLANSVVSASYSPGAGNMW